ncbi:unnamed protein product [Urochloa decumbens]
MIKESARPLTIAFMAILLVGISVADHEQVNSKHDPTTGGIKLNNGSTTTMKLLLTGHGYHRKLLDNNTGVDNSRNELCRQYCKIVKCPHPC